MEKLLTAKIHVGIVEPHTLCGGALESLGEEIANELEMGLRAVAENIRQKFGTYEDGGKGEVRVDIEM